MLQLLMRDHKLKTVGLFAALLKLTQEELLAY